MIRLLSLSQLRLNVSLASHINQVDPCIEFTQETEKENKLPFQMQQGFKQATNVYQILLTMVHAIKKRRLTKEERDQNFINKSFILNAPRVAKKFTDITTATTTQ